MHSNNFKDLTGQKFGRLTAVKFVGQSAEKRALWECLCDCGNTIIVPGKSLRTGNTKSCGCLNIETATNRIVSLNHKHGGSHSRLFKRWTGMLARCNNPHAVNYKDYGGRGIKVCEEWRSFEAFRDWAMSAGFDEKLSIDRIDPNGDYCPENCRWVNASAQANNRRSTRKITFNGETKSLSEWARKYKKDPSNLHGRTEKEIIAKLAMYERSMA